MGFMSATGTGPSMARGSDASLHVPPAMGFVSFLRSGSLSAYALSRPWACAKYPPIGHRFAQCPGTEAMLSDADIGTQYANYWAPLTTPAGAPAAAAARKQRPDATCEGTTG